VAPVTFEHVQRAAQSLPGVELSSSYGTAALKVKGKLFARLHQSGESFVLRCEFLDREMLLQADPQVFYVTDHYLDHPWVLVRLASVSAAALPDLLERAWRLVAPRGLLKLLEPHG
jgi:hypothetical protein